MQKNVLFALPETWPLVPLLSMRYIFIAFVLYLLYKLVFDLILPVSRATSQVRGQMRKMQEMHEQQFGGQQPQQAAATTPTEATPSRPSKHDYLDFEEVK